MSYEKQTWANGDVITANKLNHMEDGIADGGGGGVLIVHEVQEGADTRLDHTWQEINDALAVIVPLQLVGGAQAVCWLATVGVEEGTYYCDFMKQGGNTLSFETDNANGYPSAPK